MQLIDPNAVVAFLVVVGIAALAAVTMAPIALSVMLRASRRDRKARRESIPTYYGRLHFAC